MTEDQLPAQAEPDAPQESVPHPSQRGLASLPTVITPLTPQQIVARLDAQARRGQMAGFERTKDPDLFAVEAFATPLDHKLVATARASPGGTFLHFRCVMLLKTPAIMGFIVVTSIWPGVWLTDSMLRTWFTWYQYQTWMWYLPLTILPLPWYIWKWVKRSRGEAQASALEQLARIAPAVDGTIGTT